MTESRPDLREAYDVVVVGAGIAGVALTRELHRRNISCVALERRPALVDAGLAINLPGNAIAALRSLGLDKDLQSYGVPIGRREYRTDTGRLLFDIDEVSFWGEENIPRCMLRSDLAKLLTRDIPDEAVVRDCAVTSAAFDEDVVAITTAGGDVLSAKYLVGADGVNSSVREWCMPGESTSIAHLADASWRFIASNPGINCWTVWMGKKAIFLLIPCGLNKVYGWATINGGASDDRNGTSLLDYAKSFPAAVSQTVGEALSNSNGIFRSPLNEVRPFQWGRGRAILIGDAAHATAPVWAQGAALALEDSLTLAQLISSEPNAELLLEKYVSMRRARVCHVQAMTDRASKVARLPAYLRSILFPILGPISYRNTYGPLKLTT
jgi:2-polyprenyl-6-methoxyphenol hydroxylase-like FAD-dependent oxidoreductase